MMIKRGYETIYQGVKLMKGERYYVVYKYGESFEKTNMLYGVELRDVWNQTCLFSNPKNDHAINEFIIHAEDILFISDYVSYLKSRKDFVKSKKNEKFINDLSKEFEGLGVQLKTPSGQYRSMQDILSDLSNVYQSTLQDSVDLISENMAYERYEYDFKKRKESIITSITVINQSSKEEYQLGKYSDSPYAIHKFVDLSDEKDTAYCAYNKDGELLHEFINVPVNVKYGFEGDINE